MARHVSVIILLKEDKLLIQHRAEDAKRSPGLWGLFGGGIEEDETPLDAVFRETKEEIGYDLKDPSPVWTQEFRPGEFKYVFAESYDGVQKLILGEGQAMKWCTLEEARKLDMIKHDFPVLEKAAEIFGL